MPREKPTRPNPVGHPHVWIGQNDLTGKVVRGTCSRILRPLLVLVLLSACAHAPPAAPVFSDWPPGSSPAEIGRRAAENWLARPFIFEAGGTDRWGSHIHYAEVVTWYGALTFARAARDDALARRLVDRFDEMMRVHGAQRVDRDGHVDFSIFGALPLEIYLHTKKPEYLRLGLEFADKQWASPTADGMSAEARYWVDDMYMLPLLQLQAFRATGNRVYLDRTALAMQTYLARLQQPNGLFHHGEGSPFNWARGNGWIAAGMAELLVAPADGGDPEQEALLGDQVGLALLVVLDALGPAERIAFVLHDLFAVPFDEIAPIVGRSSAATRQLASRARRRVKEARTVPDPDRALQRRVVDAYLAAARAGDFRRLMSLLDPDVRLHADFGSAAAARFLQGASDVAGSALTFARTGVVGRPALVNGAAGAVSFRDGQIFSVMGFTVSGGRIVAIDILADAERLAALDVPRLG